MRRKFGCIGFELEQETEPVRRQHPTRMVSPFGGLAREPISVFKEWFELAKQSELNDPNAAALATATKEAIPNLRMVLVKNVDQPGLQFFTNTESQKGSELRENPVAALCFHWKSLRRQVRFQGRVQTLSREVTEEYFHSRSRASQIAAAVSQQSHTLESREVLDQANREYTEKLGDGPVPLPETWSGFLLVPDTIEFWISGEDRLHDRMQFMRDGSAWKTRLLYP